MEVLTSGSLSNALNTISICRYIYLSIDTFIFQQVPTEHCTPITFDCNSQVVLEESFIRTKSLWLKCDAFIHLKKKHHHHQQKTLSMVITSAMAYQICFGT